ncbi:hypothetical protein GW17_00032689 [Ensete ventricosum]|nr:hypothetical protein GW17_00032689 [Ensete ventricosum]
MSSPCQLYIGGSLFPTHSVTRQQSRGRNVWDHKATDQYGFKLILCLPCVVYPVAYLSCDWNRTCTGRVEDGYRTTGSGLEESATIDPRK